MNPLGLSPRLSLSKASFQRISTRNLTANEAAIALRPFYFLVHPDRYAQMPGIRQKNEKSLQIFNGYLNDLYPTQSTLTNQRSIEVSFSIQNKETKELEDVKINLSGTDPGTIVSQALEKCRLSTKDLPLRSSKSIHHNRSISPRWSPSEDLMNAYLRKKKKEPPAADIFARLHGRREEAVKMSKDYEMKKMSMKDDIDELKYKTGLKEVIWQMDWTEGHMKRCIQGVLRLLGHSGQETIQSALYKSTLRFGRGSFICCDGSLQFGADHVPEQWQKICEEASVRRSQLPNLHAMTAKLKELFPGSTILTPHHRGLAQVVQQMHTLIIRIENRDPTIKSRFQEYTDGAMIDIMTSYDELTVGVDGRLCIPCNVDIGALIEFLSTRAKEGKDLQKRINSALMELREEVSDIADELGSPGLDWDQGLPIDQVLKSARRLRTLPSITRDLLKGLRIRLSSNTTVSILGDGTISLPLNWV